MGLADETDRETVETDTLRESGPRRGDDGEVETEIIVTGETILMTGLEGAARTLLTHGPVAEVTAILEGPKADLKVSKPAKSV